MKMKLDDKKMKLFMEWLKTNVVSMNNSLPQNGAIGLYIYSK